MIRRWRSTGYRVAAGSSGSDTDALQTDVMRFMSILGLCLMAVFALVQSLPLQEAEPLQQEPERARLHEDIAIQQQRAQVLKAELERLLTQIKQANAEKSETETALSAAEQKLTEVVERAQQAQAQQQRLSSEVDRLQQRLERGRYTLASLQQAADDKVQSLRTLQQRLDKEEFRLDDIREQARELKRQQAAQDSLRSMRARQRQLAEDNRKRDETRQQARITPAPVIEKEAPPTVAKKKGFTLRFASTEALQQQVATGNVSLYAMVDKQAWQLSLPHGRPVFTGTALPQWFHEMAATTVPIEYVRQLEPALAPSARDSLVWGVQLPPTTKQGITSLTRGRQGGDLVIAADGRVTLAAE